MIRKGTVKACGIAAASGVLGLMFAPSLWNLLSLVPMSCAVGILMWLAIKPVTRMKTGRKNTPPLIAADREVIDSLRALGYSQKEAALASTCVNIGLPLEDRIRMSLLQLGKV